MGKNKKGSLLDLIYIAVFMLVIAMTSLIAFKIYAEINTEMQANDNLETYGKTALTEIRSLYPGVIDNSFLFLSVGLAIVAFVFEPPMLFPSP